MKQAEFDQTVRALEAGAASEPLSGAGRLVFMSDFHMGDGSTRDDFRRNRELVAGVLASYYLPGGWRLVLNGDIEELHKFSPAVIRATYPEHYELFSAFRRDGRLVKIVGNHDLALLLEPEYEYPLLDALRLDAPEGRILAFHGHQSRKLYGKHHRLSDLLVRYFVSPLRIPAFDKPRESRRRYRAERRIYRASKNLGAVIIAGHTHRPLFESHSKYDSMRWNIESLLRDYTRAAAEERPGIEALVRIYADELKRLSRAERSRGRSRSLYEREDLLVPSMFNSGCAVGKLGFTCIELDGTSVALSYWNRAGQVRPYIEREAAESGGPAGTPWRRYVLARDELAYVFARLRLLS